MIALDTNVLVRVITEDDETQAAVAASLMKSDRLFISKTVLLELEWVLRFAYDFERPEICGALKHLLGLSNLQVEDEAAVALGLAGYEGGMDFADALHLASCSSAVSEFATFDGGLAKKATDLEGAKPVRLLRA